MPLIFDPEYQAELDKYRDLTVRNDKKLNWLLTYLAFAFAVVFGALQAADADAPTVISAMIVVASMGLTYAVIMVGSIIHVTLVLNGAGDEWVGRKQLGEYRPPTES